MHCPGLFTRWIGVKMDGHGGREVKMEEKRGWGLRWSGVDRWEERERFT